jgi:hypothetical protein
VIFRPGRLPVGWRGGPKNLPDPVAAIAGCGKNGDEGFGRTEGIHAGQRLLRSADAVNRESWLSGKQVTRKQVRGRRQGSGVG